PSKPPLGSRGPFILGFRAGLGIGQYKLDSKFPVRVWTMQGWRATPTPDWTTKGLISSNWNAANRERASKIRLGRQEGKENFAGNYPTKRRRWNADFSPQQGPSIPQDSLA